MLIEIAEAQSILRLYAPTIGSSCIVGHELLACNTRKCGLVGFIARTFARVAVATMESPECWRRLSLVLGKLNISFPTPMKMEIE